MLPFVAATVGPVKGLLGGLLGGGPKDPAALARAQALVGSGSLVKLGKITTQAWTRPVPEPGEFYLDLRDGEIYQSKAAGLYPVTAAWAAERKAQYRAAAINTTGTTTSLGELFPAKAGLGFATVLLVGIAVVVLLFVGRK
jgi:hypothetical protein